MTSITFTGNIVPQGITISLHHGFRYTAMLPTIGKELSIDVSIQSSLVTVKMTRDGDILELDFARLWYEAIGAGSAAVHSIALATGRPLNVDLHKATMPDESTVTPMWNDPELTKIFKDVFGFTDNSRKFADIQVRVITNPHIRLALQDLIQSITHLDSTLVHCARSVEGIRHIIAGPDVKTPASWAALRKALNLDRSYLQLIMDNSTGLRHGERAYPEQEVVREIVLRCWTIMSRFLEYKLNGDVLPEDRHPILYG